MTDETDYFEKSRSWALDTRLREGRMVRIGTIIDVIVQLERRDGRRHVSQINWRDYAEAHQEEGAWTRA